MSTLTAHDTEAAVLTIEPTDLNGHLPGGLRLTLDGVSLGSPSWVDLDPASEIPDEIVLHADGRPVRRWTRAGSGEYRQTELPGFVGWVSA